MRKEHFELMIKRALEANYVDQDGLKVNLSMKQLVCGGCRFRYPAKDEGGVLQHGCSMDGDCIYKPTTLGETEPNSARPMAQGMLVLPGG